MKTDSRQSKSRPIIKTSDPAGRRRLGDNSARWWRLALVLIVIALVYFYRIDRPLLWCDEADTGMEARSILRYGYPIAYDGRNVSLFVKSGKGDVLNRNLDLVQYYLGALSLAIFGNHTAGLRMIFAMTGLLAFFPIHAVLKSRVKCPDIIAGLVLISPQIVLFQRNARYYPLLILLYSVIVWHLTTDFKSVKTRFIVALVVLMLFFHTHALAALCCCISLLLFCLFFRREALLIYLISSASAFLSWLFWYEYLGPSLVERPLNIFFLITSDFGLWLKLFFQGLGAAVFDIDVVGCFPILLWIVLFAFLLLQGRKAVLDILREPLFSFTFLNILIQFVATAALFGYETLTMYSILRYMPHLLVFVLMSCFIVLNYAIPMRSLYLLVCMFALAFNFLSLSFWVKPYPRDVPVSWFLPVYSEIFRPPQNVWDAIVAKMRSESDDSLDRDTLIKTLPQWVSDVVIFYLGDRYLVAPLLDPSDEKCKQTIRELMGEQSFRRLYGRPEWILDFWDQIKTVPKGYVIHTIFPSYQILPDQGSRPELTRRNFSQPAVVSNVKLYRLQKQ